MKLFKKNRQRYSFALIFSLVLHFLTFGYLYKNINHDQSIQRIALQKISNSGHAVKFDSVKFITHKQLE